MQVYCLLSSLLITYHSILTDKANSVINLMPLASKKKHYDDLSSSGVSSLSGSNQSVKKITIYRNGDVHHGGLKVLI